ncbi:MAG: hypothetical protein GY796_25755 [Chloroflexi bacterium]|nr:hypothetical protein [Chloroflexota bacterium]
MEHTRLNEGIEFLAAAGLNLAALLDVSAMSHHLCQQLTAANIPIHNYATLLLVGHGGRRLWTQLQKVGLHGPNPIDEYSLTLTRRFIADYLEEPDYLQLYPDVPFQPPLSQLGEVTGWSYPSPIGLGIHPQFGLWFAYRTAFLLKGRQSVIKSEAAVSPCDTCLEKPCITSCPADAVQPTQFDIFACADYRITAQSACADRCLARLACPVAPHHRYTIEQIQYHYHLSLTTIKQYSVGQFGKSSRCDLQNCATKNDAQYRERKSI